jgi:hypothetical protein
MMIEYQGKMIKPEHFRVNVYDKKGNKKLCNSYKEYSEALENGWLEVKPKPKEKKE